MNVCSKIMKHPLAVAACNFLLVMAIYSLSRLFFYGVNHDLYPDVTSGHLGEMLLGGTRFDLTALLYINSVYLLLTMLPLPATWKAKKGYIAITKGFYFIPNAIGIIVNTIDVVYFRFTDRRTTCTFFSEFQNDGNLGSILLQSATQYWHVWLFGIAMLTLLYCFYRPFQNNTNESSTKGWWYAREITIVIFTAFFVIIGIRGGFGKYTRPITISNAMQYVNRPAETAIVLNTPFSLMKSLENTTYVSPNYFDATTLAGIMSPVHIQSQDSISEATPNLCILILESFGKEHIGFYNEGKGYTPFLDSLLSQSITFQHSYASGRKSIDAMPSVLSSIPMLIEPYIVTPYSTNDISSLADALGSRYHCSFFHGAPNGSMGFQAFARSAGFKRYYGKTEYERAHPETDAFDGTWAIWDEEFLQYFLEEINQMEEPFCTSVFTASSHHPFKVPSRYDGLFPEGPIPLCQAISYSDYALRQFFQTACRQPWFNHTLFVLTADHAAQSVREEYLNDEGRYKIPIAFYAPWLAPRYDTTTVFSQIDIMPSVLGLLGHNKSYFAFGQDALTESKANNYAVCYNHPYFQIIATNGMLQYDGRQVISTSGTITEEQQAAMLTYLKAMIQQYIERMVENKLTIHAN